MKKISAAVCLILCLTMLLGSAGAQVQYDKMYVEDSRGTSMKAIPKTYLLEKAASIFGEEALMLSDARDLFVAPNGHVYIADAGSNCIVELTGDLDLVRVYDNAASGGLKRPEGVFVDEYGSVYVADTGNARIVKLDAQGNFVEEFGKPQSNLLEEDFVFNPRLVAVSSVGYIYALKYQYVMQMDAYNSFRGYIGTTEVGQDIGYMIKYFFSNPEQRKVMLKREPASCYSFDLGADGSIYVTTADRDSGELKRINSVGKNIYPKKSAFGMMVRSETGTFLNPQYIDVAVDAYENVYMLEGTSGEISVYNSQGDNLCVFGGKGETRETFQAPVALDVDDEMNIYILDQKYGGVKKFAPTRFMTLVYEALHLFDQGEYQKAEGYWQEILDRHESYYLANVGMAKLKYKQKDYAASMEYYRMAEDQEGYTTAFGKEEMVYFRDHFGQVVLIGAGVLAGLAAAVYVCQRFIRKKMDKYSHLI